MKSKAMTYAAYLVAICGVVMHAYLTALHTMTGSLFYYIVPVLNFIPYLICLVMTMSSTRPIMLLCAGLMVLSTDLYLFQDYFFSDKTYRFQFLESYQVIFKTAVIVPAGCLVGYLIDKWLLGGAGKRVD